MSNPLAPGAGGFAAPQATPANALAPQGPSAPPGPSPMMQHFGDELSAAGAQFQRVKDAEGRFLATQKELAGLLELKDTITQDDVVKAAAGIVSAGIPATQVAMLLSEMPEGAEALQSWVGQKAQEIEKTGATVAGAMQTARYKLGLSALKHIIGHSAESSEQKRMLAAATPQGRA